MAHLAGLAADDAGEAEALPQHGVHALDLDDRPLAAVVFYRSHLLSDDIAPVTALLDGAAGARVGGGRDLCRQPEGAGDGRVRGRHAGRVAAGGGAERDGILRRALAGGANVPAGRRRRAGAATHPRRHARAAWQARTRGLTPADLAMQVVLPELDGRLLTTAISFKAERDGRTVHEPDADGIALAADRAAGWAGWRHPGREAPGDDRAQRLSGRRRPARARGRAGRLRQPGRDHRRCWPAGYDTLRADRRLVDALCHARRRLPRAGRVRAPVRHPAGRRCRTPRCRLG